MRWITLIAFFAAALVADDFHSFIDLPGKAAIDAETGKSNTGLFNLKPVEAAAFNGNLRRLSDLLLAQPAFNPIRGANVRGYIRADDQKPAIKTNPVSGFGHIIYYPFIKGSDSKPYPVQASPWEIEIFLNAPGRGLSAMNLRDPAKQLKLLYEPAPAGQLHGFPVYRDGDNNEFIVLSSTGKPAWIPVTREEYIRLWIRVIEEDLASNGVQGITQQRLQHHQDALARMSPQERAAQAQYGDPGNEDLLGPMLAPVGKAGVGAAYVKANPDWFDTSRPRSDLQLIVLSFNWRGDLDPDHPKVQENSHAAPLRLWETLHTSDWKTISGVLTK